jgi:hypothetical protein
MVKRYSVAWIRTEDAVAAYLHDAPIGLFFSSILSLVRPFHAIVLILKDKLFVNFDNAINFRQSPGNYIEW